MVKPTKFIIFQKTGFPLFIYDLKNKEMIDSNDPEAFMLASYLCLEMSDMEIEPGKVYALTRKEEKHFFSLVGNGAFIDISFPVTQEGEEDLSEKTSKIMKILRDKIKAVHEKIGLPDRDLSLVSDSLYREKVAPKLTSFLTKIASGEKEQNLR